MTVPPSFYKELSDEKVYLCLIADGLDALAGMGRWP